MEFIEDIFQEEERDERLIKKFISEIKIIDEIQYPFSTTDIQYENYLFSETENKINRRFNTMVLKQLRAITEQEEEEKRENKEEQSQFISIDMNEEEKSIMIALLSMKDWIDIDLHESENWYKYGEKYGFTRSSRCINMFSDRLYDKENEFNRKLLKPPSQEELILNLKNEDHIFLFVVKSQNQDTHSSLYNVSCNKIATKFSCQCLDMIKSEIGFDIYNNLDNNENQEERIKVWDKIANEFIWIYPIPTMMPCKHIRMCYLYLKWVELSSNDNDIIGKMEEIQRKERIQKNLHKHTKDFLNKIFSSYCYEDGTVKVLRNKNKKKEIKEIEQIFTQEEYYQPVFFTNYKNKPISISQLYQGQMIQKESINDYLYLFKREGFTKNQFFTILNKHYGWTEHKRGYFIASYLSDYFKEKKNPFHPHIISYYVPTIEVPMLEYFLSLIKRKEKRKTDFFQKVTFTRDRITCSCFLKQHKHLMFCEHIIALYWWKKDPLMLKWIQLTRLSLSFHESFHDKDFKIINTLYDCYENHILVFWNKQIEMEYYSSVKSNEPLIYIKTGFQKRYYSYTMKIVYNLVEKKLTFTKTNKRKKREEEKERKKELNYSITNYFNKKNKYI